MGLFSLMIISWTGKLTNSFVGIKAGVFNGSIVAFLWVFLVLFVDSIGTVSVGQPVVCKVDLQYTTEHMHY